MSEKPEPVELPLVWDESDAVVLVANQFSILGTDADGFFLTVGQVVPVPTRGGTDEERRESLEKAGAMFIRPIGRYSLSPARLRELHQMLGKVVEHLPEVSK